MLLTAPPESPMYNLLPAEQAFLKVIVRVAPAIDLPVANRNSVGYFAVKTEPRPPASFNFILNRNVSAGWLLVVLVLPLARTLTYILHTLPCPAKTPLQVLVMLCTLILVVGPETCAN